MKKNIKKIFTTFILVSLFLSPISLVVYGQVNDSTNNFNLQTQIERLEELFDYEPTDSKSNEYFRTFHNLDSENIPNVVLMSTPQTEDDKILIGLETEPTQEDIDFILDFTGIPIDNVEILHFEYETVKIYDGVVETCDNGFYIDFFKNSSEPIIKPRQITGGVVSMGQMTNIPGVGNLTIGHPNNAAGTGFFTAPHGQANVGTRVNHLNTNVQIGRVLRTANGGNRDFAEVNTSSFGVNVARRVPWANRNITNFRGTPANGQSVRSIRGRSGVQNIRIDQARATFTTNGVTWRDMILTYPNANARDGDSGSALIRTNGTNEIVLGVKRGTFTAGGRVFGVYSSVLNYN